MLAEYVTVVKKKMVITKEYKTGVEDTYSPIDEYFIYFYFSNMPCNKWRKRQFDLYLVNISKVLVV